MRGCLMFVSALQQACGAAGLLAGLRRHRSFCCVELPQLKS